MIKSETTTQRLLNHAEYLESGDYILIEADEKDTDYIVNLALTAPFCKVTEEEILESYYNNYYATWLCLYKEILVGVVMIRKVFVPQMEKDIFTLDAYSRTRHDGSVHAKFGTMALDWAKKQGIDTVWTAHDVRNRAATVACLRIGFKKCVEIKGQIVMRRA